MLTPKEVQDQSFPVQRKGYDMDAVDEFLDTLTGDYTKLYTQYGKLYTAYNKLSRRSQEQSEAYEQLRTQSPAVNTQQIFLSAHKDADAIRSSAEAERLRIINEATDYAYSNAERLKNEYAELQAAVDAAKRERDAIRAETEAESVRLNELQGRLAEAESRMDTLTSSAEEYLYRFRTLQRFAGDSAEHLEQLLKNSGNAVPAEQKEAAPADPADIDLTIGDGEDTAAPEEAEADDGEPEELSIPEGKSVSTVLEDDALLKLSDEIDDPSDDEEDDGKLILRAIEEE